jgi:hypothetical protein
MNQSQSEFSVRREICRAMSTLVCFLSLQASGVSEAGQPSLEVISAWGGPVNDVEVVGNTAYIAAGRRLVIADVTNLSAITEIGSIELGANVRDVAIQGGLAYVATNGAPNYFCVVNVANPTNPAVVWNAASIVPPSDQFSQVELYGNRAYVREGNTVQSAPLDVYDLSQPTAPVRLGSIIENRSKDFEIVGDLLFVTIDQTQTDPAALSIYDLAAADPLNPSLVGTLPFAAGRPAGLAVDGNLAFVSIDVSGASYVAIINVFNAATPSVASTVPTDVDAQELAAANGHLYVPDIIAGTHRQALEIYDVTNPAAPAFITTYQTHATIRDILFAGPLNRGWLLDDGEGLIALNISNPAGLVRLGNYYSPATLRGMDKPASGNLLYVADAWNGLTILDVSNPQITPTVVGNYQTPAPHNDQLRWTNWEVAIDGTRAWLTACRQGVHVVNVSNPASPSLLTTLVPPINWGARAIDIANGVAHVSLQDLGLFPVNWQYRTYNATSLAALATITVNGGVAAYSIAVNPQGIAFTGRDAQSPQVISASNPSAPFVINDDAGPTNSNFVAISGTLRFLVNDSNTPQYPAPGLYIHNVSNPASPTLVSFISGGAANAVAVEGDHVYGAGMFGSSSLSCTVWDISTASSPQPIVSAPRIGMQEDTRMLVDEPHLYVTTSDGTATADHGLVILEGANLSVPPTQSEGMIYWADGNSIKRAGLDGLGVETIADALDGVHTTGGLALDLAHGKVYFTSDMVNPGSGNADSILRVDTDGSTVQTIVSDIEFVTKLAVDPIGGKVYWCGGASNDGWIWRANLDGTDPQLLHDLEVPTYITLDHAAGKLYWGFAAGFSCNGKIERSNLDGSAREDVITGLTYIRGLAVDHDGGKIYWSERCGVDLLRRANLDGSNPETVFPFAQTILGMAIDPVADKLYFTEISGQLSIMRCNLNGSQLEPVIAVGLTDPNQIDVQPAPALCPADIAPRGGNGVVNIDDLLAVISNWGQGAGNPADVDGNGTVNIDDLLAVISGWGPCK